MIDRRVTKYNHNGEIETQYDIDVDWELIRHERNAELARTDFWALKDLTMSQEKKDYRIFLRNLPQDFETANEAADAWLAYSIPE